MSHTDNNTGSINFFDLNTNKIVHRDKWTEVPLTQDIIDRINQVATNERLSAGIDAPTIFTEEQHIASDETGAATLLD